MAKKHPFLTQKYHFLMETPSLLTPKIQVFYHFPSSWGYFDPQNDPKMTQNTPKTPQNDPFLDPRPLTNPYLRPQNDPLFDPSKYPQNDPPVPEPPAGV
jgi:hypothetical protein